MSFMRTISARRVLVLMVIFLFTLSSIWLSTRLVIPSSSSSLSEMGGGRSFIDINIHLDDSWLLPKVGKNENVSDTLAGKEKATRRTDEADGNDATTTSKLQEFRAMEELLESYDERFYMYPDDAMRQTGARYQAVNQQSRMLRPVLMKSHGRDVISEVQLLEALEAHPLRTKDPAQATQFIVPIPTGAIARRDVVWNRPMEPYWRIRSFQLGHNHTPSKPCFSPPILTRSDDSTKVFAASSHE